MDRDQYVAMLKQRLDEWNTQISKTEEEIKEASSEARARYEEHLADLKKQAAEAEEKFQAFVKEQSEDWDKQRAAFETAWKDIAEGFTRAFSRFK